MSWQAQAETILRAAAGQDIPGPLYIIDGDELPEALRPAGECLGITSGSLSTALRPWLVARDQWQGEGFAAVVFPSPVAAEFGLTMPQVIDGACINVAMHEAAHEIERLATVAKLLPAGAVQPPVDAVAALAALRSPQAEREPWSGHGWQFIRCAAHLSYRAMQAGFWLPLTNMSVAGQRYRLSSATDYRLALGDEPQRCIGQRRLVEVLTSPPPEEFTALWESDTSR